ncbi:hypothetical protein CsSME_00028330 [Camellia sinensis var. sinensis]
MKTGNNMPHFSIAYLPWFISELLFKVKLVWNGVVELTFGLVDCTNYKDMKYAIQKLDDTEFRNPWTRTYIREQRPS